jgi:hypothetical protein
MLFIGYSLRKRIRNGMMESVCQFKLLSFSFMCSGMRAQKEQKEKLKIRMENDIMLVPVQVSGHPFNFLLDTGSELSTKTVPPPANRG